MLTFCRLGVVLAIYLCAPLLSVARDCSVPPFLIPLSSCVAQPHDTITTSAYSWGVNILVGVQELCVTPSTVTNDTFLPSSDVCLNDNSTLAACTSRRGGLLSLPDSGSSFAETGALNNTMDPNWESIQGTAKTLFGNVTLKSPPDILLSNFTVGIFAGGQNHSNGHLGFAQNSGFLRRLVDEGFSATEAFSINVGSQFTNRSGELVIGGYNARSIATYYSEFNITSSPLPVNRFCPLQVRIRQLDIIYEGVADSVPLIGPAAPVYACIEIYDSLYRLPPSIFNAFKNELSIFRNFTFDPKEFFVPGPGLMFDSTIKFNGSFRFILDNGSQSGNDFAVTIPKEELTRPLQGIAGDGTIVQRSNITEMAVYYQDALFDTAVLGKAFLSRAHLSVLYHDNKFRLAHFTQDTLNGVLTGPNLVAFNCTSPESVQKKNHKAAVIGGSVGGVLALVVLVSMYIIYKALGLGRQSVATQPTASKSGL